jgi:DegV family protein with EDD domain
VNRSEAVPGQTFLEKKVLCGKENGMAADSQGKQEETSMKVAVVTDSNSGITQAQAKEMGVYVLPMPFMIDGTEYLEDINLTQKEFYEHLSGDHDVSTSQPSPETILNLWEKLLEEYDAVVHIPMSSGLSSSCQTAKMLAEDFDGKVQVADNHRISVTQRRSVQDALEMAAAGMDAEAICKKLEETGLDSTIYITVDTLKYLKKGGRITPAAAALGTLLRLKPVLTIQGEKLDAFAKARTMKQARSMMITAITRDLETRFDDVRGEKTYIDVAHTDNDEMAQELAAELRELFPETEVRVEPLSLSVACHIGPGALAIAATKKLEIGSLL